MTILLTGGAGFIGSHIAVELLNEGYSVVIVDNYSNSTGDVVKRINSITGKCAVSYSLDLENKSALERVFAENKIDAVIHCAGLKSVGESVKMPLKYYGVNISSTISLLETMNKYGVSNIIFSSSATVYGTPEELPLTEASRVGPCANPYGWTKLMIEQIISDEAVANPDISAVLLRYFNPIGAHESGLIGETPAGVPNNLMPYITQVAAGKLERLSVYGNDYPTKDGTGVRDYLHVTDLAKGHVSAISYCTANKGVEVLNLGTGNGFSVLEIVDAFEKANGLKIPYVIAPRRDGDIASCYADTAKAKNLLGWSAEKSIEDMCRDSWNWEQKSKKL